ncbi:type VI secretion system lipoprotein TssJ [Paraburkholderia sp. GAS334]|uniref:type VI secretion system lipoprotein TssJ n=1 Tax=unclassified Paraburkholderia TaxID=2615204 RepID=UPI003D1FFFEB
MNHEESVRTFPVVVVVGLCLTLSACGAWQSVSEGTASTYNAVFHKTVKTLNVDLSARSALNSGAAGEPLSVAVRIYQLKDRKAFDVASYDDLLQNDRTVLAQDLLDTASAIVTPGGAVNLSQPIRADTQYVAVVAFFRDSAGGGNWRRVFPKKALSPDNPLKLQLIDNELVVTSDVPEERPAP